MVRKLKYHEQKLLKKVDFINWKLDNNVHEVKVLKRYHIQKREDYTVYNKLSRQIRDLARKIKELDPKEPFRTEVGAQLLEKLYVMGLIPKKSDFELCNKVTASQFCRRRLAVVMARSKMAPDIKTATQFIEQGHVLVGSEQVKDPAYLVTSCYKIPCLSSLVNCFDLASLCKFTLFELKLSILNEITPNFRRLYKMA